MLPYLFGTKSRDQLVGSDQTSFHKFCFLLYPLSISGCRLIVGTQVFQLVLQLLNVSLDLIKLFHRLMIDALQFGNLSRMAPRKPINSNKYEYEYVKKFMVMAIVRTYTLLLNVLYLISIVACHTGWRKNQSVVYSHCTNRFEHHTVAVFSLGGATAR